MIRQLIVEPIFKQGLKLDAQQPTLGQHAAPLLDEVAEILLQRRMGQHQGLAKEGAHLRAADVEGIAQPCQIRHGHIILPAAQAVAQPGTIDEQVESQLLADAAHFLQLMEGVDGAVLGGVGDVDQLRLGGVLHALVDPMQVDKLRHLCGGDLAVGAGQGQTLVAGGLHRAGLVDMDMAALGADRRLMGPQRRRQHRQIGLGAAHQKVDCRILPTAFAADVGGSILTVVVRAVAGCLLQIRFHHSAQDPLVAALAVITRKVYHNKPPEMFPNYKHYHYSGYPLVRQWNIRPNGT